MKSREDVIKGIECNLNFVQRSDCKCCGYKCDKEMFLSVPINLLADALALLKAQEPRVMMPEEVQSLPEGVVVWFEELDNGGRSYIQPMMSNGKAFMIGTHLDINVSNGAINWTGRRFWTSRPIKEQMEAVKWE